MKQALTNNLIDLIARKKDYTDAVRFICDELPRRNKELYRLILRDLIYHFEPTRSAPTRARIERDGKMWTADSYETIAKRISERMKKHVSVKTLQRYHNDMVKRHWVCVERHMFAGKSMLHRCIAAEKVDFDLHRALVTRRMKDAALLVENENARRVVEEARLSEASSARTVPTTTAEIDGEAALVIAAGDVLFGLGTLMNRRRKTTRWCIARIKELISVQLLSVDAINSLKDAWENGVFNDRVRDRSGQYDFWPNWLSDFYPRGRAISQGLAAYWFVNADPGAYPWLKGNSLNWLRNCQQYIVPAFEQLYTAQRSTPSPEDYHAYNEIGGFDMTRSEAYFKQLYPGRNPSEMELPFG